MHGQLLRQLQQGLLQLLSLRSLSWLQPSGLASSLALQLHCECSSSSSNNGSHLWIPASGQEQQQQVLLQMSGCLHLLC
jgi:hypothetical protein